MGAMTKRQKGLLVGIGIAPPSRWTSRRARVGEDWGSSLLEMALLSPLLLGLLVGVIELGRYAYYSILVANAVNLLDPECVVIGGGIAARLGDLYVAPARRTAYQYLLRARDAKRVKIVPGTLGDSAGALGAVLAARQWLHNSCEVQNR